jgi:hypothetical protein
MARRAGYYERTVDEFGKPVETYAGIPMLDVGKYHNGLIARDVIPITEGYTEIFAVCFGPDAFHGISTTGNSVIRAYLPGPEDHAIKKTGSVELVAGVVLKNTKKAAVLKNIHLGM